MDHVSTEVERVTSVEGVEVALHHLGGSGPPLLICHATGFHGLAYGPLAAALTDDFRVIALDFRGHGATAAPPSGDFRWMNMASDVVACIEAATDEPVIGVGHSMGGASILLAEKMRPGTFAGAYLFEPIVFPQAFLIGRSENPMSGPARKRRAIFPTKQAALERYASRPPLDGLHRDSLAAYVEHGFVPTEDGQVQLACLPESEARTFEAEDKMTLEEIEGLSLRLVVGAGGEAEGPATFAPAIASTVEGASLIVYEDLGHFGPLEAPERIGRDILEAFTDR